ncbi:MAG: hypothetical protein AAFW81_00815 [Pseudomonadota bacterium]
MAFLLKFFEPMSSLGRRLGLCGMIGAIAGMIAGGSLSLIDFMHGGLAPTQEELLYVFLTLTVFAWALILFILYAFGRLRIGPLLLPSLFNVALVVALILLISDMFSVYNLAWIFGPVIGALIGILLCKLPIRIFRVK